MRIRAVTLGLLGLGFSYACSGSSGDSGSAPGAGGDAGTTATAGTGDAGRAAAAGGGNRASGGSAGKGSGESAGQPGGGAAGESTGTNDGGAAGTSDEPTILPDAIDLTGTKFLDYGTLRVAFEQAVAAASMQVKLEPAERLQVTGVAQVDAKTVDVSLGYYHLPHDYRLTVLGRLADHTLFQASATLSGLNNGSRIAFLSKGTGTGDLRSWTTPAATGTPLQAADAVCQGEAQAAGFKGTFVAFLSTRASYDAGCRAFGLSGLLVNHCGQASAPADDKPWLSPYGLPIMNGATSVVAGLWNTPISYHADGTTDGSEHFWTGTLPGAQADTGTGPISPDCTGWTSTANYAETANFAAQYLIEYGDGGGDCSDAHGLICLQVGGPFFGTGSLYRALGKRTFVSKGTLTGAMSFGGKTGVAAGDALCQAEAAGAGYANAPNFRAYLSTAATDAMCHVLGATGKATDQCGLAALPAGVWRRPDDYPVADAADLINGFLTAPISLAPDLSQQVDVRPWTGLSTPSTCSDWTSAATASTADVGTARSTSYAWSAFSTANCNTPAPLFCFEG